MKALKYRVANIIEARRFSGPTFNDPIPVLFPGVGHASKQMRDEVVHLSTVFLSKFQAMDGWWKRSVSQNTHWGTCSSPLADWTAVTRSRFCRLTATAHLSSTEREPIRCSKKTRRTVWKVVDNCENSVTPVEGSTISKHSTDIDQS